MLVKLSSEGRLIIPRAIRERLGLKEDALFYVELIEDQRIVLEPVRPETLAALHGKYADAPLLDQLEEEHRQEIGHDALVRA